MDDIMEYPFGGTGLDGTLTNEDRRLLTVGDVVQVDHYLVDNDTGHASQIWRRAVVCSVSPDLCVEYDDGTKQRPIKAVRLKKIESEDGK